MANHRRRRQLATLALFLPALLQLFPMFYLLCVAFKSSSEVIQYPPRLLPRTLDLSNFQTAVAAAPLGRMLGNSLFVATAMTGLQLVTSILAAFALARLKFPGKKLIFGLILATLMIPGEVTLIPNYFTLASLGWLDTYKALVLPYAASGFGIFLLYQFFMTVPTELAEAVALDGGSELRFLLQFMVPLAWPAILAFGIYAFVNAWNQYLWPLVATQSTEMQTVQIGIGLFRAQNESTSWGVIMAATTILISPTIFLFLATQKHFIRGITMSGVK